MMMVSIIRGGISRVNWLLQTLDRHPFRKREVFFKHGLSYPHYLHHTLAGEWLGYFCLHLKHLAHDSQPNKLNKILVNTALAKKTVSSITVALSCSMHYCSKAVVAEILLSHIFSFQKFLHAHHEIQDRATHHTLYEDLVNYIWIHVVTNLRNNPL
jgi:hypothetical protein